jgi:hypothetical protein
VLDPATAIDILPNQAPREVEVDRRSRQDHRDLGGIVGTIPPSLLFP